MKNFAERLRSARRMAGLSMQELVDKMNNAISKQAIGKYELGQMHPNNEIILLLAKALDIRPDYFIRENTVVLKNIEFRKLQKLPTKNIDVIKERVIDFLERYFELEELLGINVNFENPINNVLTSSQQEIENAAEALRKKWKLGLDAIPNVVEMLEDQGIKVFEVEADDSFTGMSTWANETPVIVLNNILSQKLDRKRFTAIHELAHLILEIPSQIDNKEKEKICHQFAGAFLIPQEVFIREFGKFRNNIYLKELIIMKEHFGVSIHAIIARAKNLSLISEQTYKDFIIDMSRLGYRKDEPGTYKCSFETSKRFKQLLFRAVAEEVITIGKAAALFNQKLSDFRDTLEKID